MRLSKLMFTLLLLCLAPTVLAQTDCPAIVSAALETADSVCGQTERNQLCYGNILLDATPREGVADFQFEDSGDIANVADVQTLQLSTFNLTNQEWGVALMKVQANLPDEQPALAATFLLFGDVTIGDSDPDSPEVTLTATGNVNVRLRPTTTEDNVIAGLQANQAVVATGRLDDESWVRIQLPDDESSEGWVSAQFLRGDTSALAVIVPEAPQFGPMQAFYFTSGVDDRPCESAPDSGILIQTPEGVGEVSFLVNEVDIQLGSTVYLQAANDFMTATVIEGSARLTAFDVTQLVPAGTFSRVPLDANGVASAAPEFPQPYDTQALAALPIALGVFQSVTLAPALAEEDIQPAIDILQLPESGQWTTTLSGASSGGCTVQPSTSTLTLVFNADGTLTATTAITTFTMTTTDNVTYTMTVITDNGGTINDLIWTFDSPTTFTGGERTRVGDCDFTRTVTGQWTSP